MPLSKRKNPWKLFFKFRLPHTGMRYVWNTHCDRTFSDTFGVQLQHTCKTWSQLLGWILPDYLKMIAAITVSVLDPTLCNLCSFNNTAHHWFSQKTLPPQDVYASYALTYPPWSSTHSLFCLINLLITSKLKGFILYWLLSFKK
jgi:hypothetical protein